jgi:hypothetical protein|tara:strand:- start:1089 stop:1286 length:198 start_codon:yes stop_codon:yes gene_type:complete
MDKINNKLDKPNKILILKLLDNVEKLQKDFSEMRIELEKYKNNNDFVNIETTNKIEKQKKTGWFF